MRDQYAELTAEEREKAFNSLFEMPREPPKPWRSPEEAFNSLFEMRRLAAAAAGGWSAYFQFSI